MPKTQITREKARKTVHREWNGYSQDEVMAAVCKYFCQGHTPADITRLLQENLHISLTREEPYRLLSRAAAKGHLRFHAPLDYELAEQIQSEFPWLKSVTVVRTGVSDDVSYHVARKLLELVRSFSAGRGPQDEVHLGFAGGSALRKAARRFAEALRESNHDLPARIVFHAMVAGFIFKETPSDPNSFFGYFTGEPALRVKTSFVGLHAPGLVPTDRVADLLSFDYVHQAYDRASEIDIIVTSAGGHWQAGHSLLFDMYRTSSPTSLRQLNDAGCLGDMMWRPFGPSGPLEFPTDVRTMTLLDLSQLPGLIQAGKEVLLALGPCGQCGGAKTDILRAILCFQQRLITHLVVDSRSAAGLVASLKRGWPLSR
jgi:hypothetical protein